MGMNNFFGQEIKRIRTSKNMTINELSKKASISTAYISQIETGKRDTPTPDVVKKIAYGLSTDYYNLMRIAGYLSQDENNFVTLEQIANKISDEEKLKLLIADKETQIKPLKGSEKNIANSNGTGNFEIFLENKLQNDLQFIKNLEGRDLDEQFNSFLNYSKSAGVYLKILRLFNEINPAEMANLLELDEEQYNSLENTLKKDSLYLIENSEKIGGILNVGDFLNWYKFIIKQDRLANVLKGKEDSEYKQICLDVQAVEKKTNKAGKEYYVEYTHEELISNLFNLEYLLNQKEHKVFYKERALTDHEIEKVKTMLNIIFD